MYQDKALEVAIRTVKPELKRATGILFKLLKEKDSSGERQQGLKHVVSEILIQLHVTLFRRGCMLIKMEQPND
jgi:hypothetical protein